MPKENLRAICGVKINGRHEWTAYEGEESDDVNVKLLEDFSDVPLLLLTFSLLRR